MGQSHSLPTEEARLLFSSNSLRNTLIQCDALGIHYQLSTPTGKDDGNLLKNERTTTITRWDPQQEKDIVIAEWQRKQFGSDRIRLSFKRPLIVDGHESDGGYISIKQFFPRTSGVPGGIHVKRTFATNNGRIYSWRAGYFSLKLFEEGSDIPIAVFSSSHCLCPFNHKPHIKLAPGYEEILDYIVVTGVIAERRRRDAKRRRQRSSGGGP